MSYVFETAAPPVRDVRPLAERLRKGEPVLGAACYLGSVAAAEMLARSAFDFLYIDQQHGLVSFDTMVAMLRAIGPDGPAAIVRVLANDAALIGQALDAGATGVIVPMVNSRADAERAVAACRYAPAGVRSYGPLRASLYQSGAPRDADARVVCLAMIETREGVEQAEEIAATPGLDGVYIGQADLAVSLGLEPQLRIQPGTHAEAIAKIRAACDAANIATGLSGDPQAMIAQGFRFITTGSDQGMIAAALAALHPKLTAARTGENV